MSKKTKHSTKTHLWRRIIVSSTIGVAFNFVVSFIFSLYYNHAIYIDLKTIIATVIVSILLFEALRLINKNIDKKHSWHTKPGKRFIMQLLFNLGFVILTLSCLGILISLYVAKDPFINTFDLIVINLVGIVFISIVVGIELILFLLNNWRGSLVEIERFKKKNAEAKFEILKNQLSPHFLFNNLNTLYGLINDDNQLASNYLLKLSDIYRYILEIKDIEAVHLAKEYHFIKDYAFLMSIRYGEYFNIKFSLDKKLLNNKYVPPFTLQLLIENAIKHNVIDDEQILFIKVYNENDKYVVVENNLLLKPQKTVSTKIGFENLESRYRFLSSKKIIINKTEHNFIVKVPLLDIFQIKIS